MTAVKLLVRALALIGAVSLPCGCTGDQGVSHDAAFDATASDPGGKAIILVGLRVLNEPTQHGLFSLFQSEAHPVYEVKIRRMSEDGRFARLSRQLNICEASRSLLNGVLSDCMPDQAHYRVLSVPPGRYTVESIAYQVDRLRIVTDFNTPESPGVFGGSSNYGDAVRDPARSFIADSGSITYIGDLTFYFDPGRAAAGMRLARDDEAARDALSSYPNLHGTPVFRSATGEEATAAPPTGLPPIEGRQ